MPVSESIKQLKTALKISSRLTYENKKYEKNVCTLVTAIILLIHYSPINKFRTTPKSRDIYLET